MQLNIMQLHKNTLAVYVRNASHVRHHVSDTQRVITMSADALAAYVANSPAVRASSW